MGEEVWLMVLPQSNQGCNEELGSIAGLMNECYDGLKDDCNASETATSTTMTRLATIAKIKWCQSCFHSILAAVKKAAIGNSDIQVMEIADSRI